MATELNNFPKLMAKWGGEKVIIEATADALRLERKSDYYLWRWGEIRSIEAKGENSTKPRLLFSGGSQGYNCVIRSESVSAFKVWLENWQLILTQIEADKIAIDEEIAIQNPAKPGHQFDMTVIDGGGWSPEISSRVEVYLMQASIEFALDGSHESRVVVPFDELTEIDIRLSQVQTGGGFGYFGNSDLSLLSGAWRAKFLNDLTIKYTSWFGFQLRSTTGWTIGIFGESVSPRKVFGGKAVDESALMQVKAEFRPAIDAVARNSRPKAPLGQASKISIADEILKLTSLRDSGVLSTEEFERAKNRVLES